MKDVILNVQGVSKEYDKFSLRNVSFSITRGFIMGFVGQNGAGKSTTIKCIMDLISFDQGMIEVFGLDSHKHSIEIKNRVGYVSEEQYFYDDMTAEWTGKFVGGFFDKWDNAFFEKLLKRFNIDRSKKVKDLSKGMKMKLSLAAAMAHRPEFLILDEPTSGLDPVIRSELLEMFLDIIQDENCSILFSSHITSDIEKVADYVTVIDNGRIILSEDKDLVLEKWKTVKLENRYYCNELCRLLKGVKKGEFGFSGITDNMDVFSRTLRSYFADGCFKAEKTNLDELLVRLAKDGEVQC